MSPFVGADPEPQPKGSGQALMTQRKSGGTGMMNRLRLVHLESGLTQREVAAEAGLDVGTIWRYEDGRVKPSDVALKLLSVI